MTIVIPSDLPRWCHWLAQDRDGSWWAFEHEPNLAFDSWYENEVGRSEKVALTSRVADWQQSLIRIEKT